MRQTGESSYNHSTSGLAIVSVESKLSLEVLLGFASAVWHALTISPGHTSVEMRLLMAVRSDARPCLCSMERAEDISVVAKAEDASKAERVPDDGDLAGVDERCDRNKEKGLGLALEATRRKPAFALLQFHKLGFDICGVRILATSSVMLYKSLANTSVSLRKRVEGISATRQ